MRMALVAIVQARMGSSRLPGKVLLPLKGGTVLSHVLARAAQITDVSRVCVATSELARDDVLVHAASKLGIAVVRGSETDVLSRFDEAAEAMQASSVIRITCDCPLLDPALCTKLVEKYRAEGADYGAIDSSQGWPRGLDCEIFPREALRTAAREATAPHDREHVTPWIIRHAQRPVEISPPRSMQERWVLDHPQDYAFLRAVYERLSNGNADWLSVLNTIETSADLLKLRASLPI